MADIGEKSFFSPKKEILWVLQLLLEQPSHGPKIFLMLFLIIGLVKPTHAQSGKKIWLNRKQALPHSKNNTRGS